MKNKTFNYMYYPFLVIFILMFIGQFTIIETKIVDEYDRCSICVRRDKESLCDCQTITENNGGGI